MVSLVALFSLWLFALSADGHQVVETSFGKLIGDREHLRGCDQFLGVPFAKPPVGELRFEDPAPWSEAYPASGRQATSYGANCPQLGVNGVTPGMVGSEDCLFLNVWRTSERPKGLVETMVFIYGGGWISGGTSASILGVVPNWLNIYDGCGFVAKQKVIVATLNYRVGPLGFAAFEESGGLSGNFAMKDQRRALQWLHKELPAFGGDPSKVTIFGESAGGMSVFYHVASPLSKGLFRAAISESGFPTAWSAEKGLSSTSKFAAPLGCTNRAALKACMKKLPTEFIILNMTNTANPFAFPTGSPPWQPVVDGVDMPKFPMTLFKEGKTNGVPMLAGHNTDESNLFVWPFYEKGMNQSQFSEWFHKGLLVEYPIEAVSDPEAQEVLSMYDSDNLQDKRAVAAQISTNVAFQCGTYSSAQSYKNDIYVYRFNHRSACAFWLKHLMPGVYHTEELQYIWGVQAKLGCVFLPEEDALSKRMQTMWANFAKCLSPTCGGSEWPKYDNSTRKALVLQTPADIVEEDYQSKQCGLWERLIYDKYKVHSGGPKVFKDIVV